MDDELLDSLPIHLRNKVLDHWHVDGDLKSTPQGEDEQRTIHPSLLVLSAIVFTLWTLPLTAVGLVFAITLILAPVGFVVCAIGALPFVFLLLKGLGA